MNLNVEEMRYEAELLTRQLATTEYKEYVVYVKRDYVMKSFHETCADHLQRFEEGHIRKLMFTIPPQHGKSELATRLFIPYMFGRKPDRKLALLSYSADKARKFSREIQQYITTDDYRALFPNIRLATAKDEAAVRTMQEFDIVGHRGSLKAVGRRGPITGDPVDIAVLDDLVKDNVEAQSDGLMEKAWEWIETTVESRLHNDSQMLYVTTRWDENDPSGRFLKRDGFYHPVTNPDGWVLLNFPALKTTDITPYDPRHVGEALWPEKHSQHRMEQIKKNAPTTFNALYQGDPQPSLEATIFPEWIVVDEFPEYVDHEFQVIDFGYSNDPTAALRVGKLGRSLYVDELFYETGLTNQDILVWGQATGMSHSLDTICDKAEPKSIEELNRGYMDPVSHAFYKGMNARGCDKGAGSIVAGISKLKEFTVYVTKRSLNILKERKNYTWIMSGGKATNTPIGKWNHAIDAVRAGVFTLYGTPLRQPSSASRPPVQKPMSL